MRFDISWCKPTHACIDTGLRWIDIIERERDEACSSLQEAQVHQLGPTSTFGGIESRSSAFVHGICQQRDYYNGIVQTWLTCVLAFAPGIEYPIPPLSYISIDIFAY